MCQADLVGFGERIQEKKMKNHSFLKVSTKSGNLLLIDKKKLQIIS
jgi:hypothetical protein